MDSEALAAYLASALATVLGTVALLIVRRVNTDREASDEQTEKDVKALHERITRERIAREAALAKQEERLRLVENSAARTEVTLENLDKTMDEVKKLMIEWKK